MPLLVIVLFIVTLLAGANAQAVSLAGRPTDDSVCDLSPMTNYRLTRKVFIPARTRNVSEIYARLALQFITAECKNEQLLILHTDFGSSDDDGAFRQVSNELCSIATIQREATPTSDYPNSFQIKCRIQKMQDAKQRLVAAESKQPIEELIRTGSPWITSEQQAVEADRREKPEDCAAKLSFGQVLLGLGGRCKRE